MGVTPVRIRAATAVVFDELADGGVYPTIGTENGDIVENVDVAPGSSLDGDIVSPLRAAFFECSGVPRA